MPICHPHPLLHRYPTPIVKYLLMSVYDPLSRFIHYQLRHYLMVVFFFLILHIPTTPGPGSSYIALKAKGHIFRIRSL
jgi:hypothetical protein